MSLDSSTSVLGQWVRSVSRATGGLRSPRAEPKKGLGFQTTTCLRTGMLQKLDSLMTKLYDPKQRIEMAVIKIKCFFFYLILILRFKNSKSNLKCNCFTFVFFQL